MKKILLTAATTLGLSLVPVVGAHALAPSTDISASQDQSANVAADKSNSSSSTNTSYTTSTVNYLAESLVEYSATTTSYTNSTQNNESAASLLANAMNNSQSQFSMPAFLAQYDN